MVPVGSVTNSIDAAIIAGGASRRMGYSKALIEINGVPLIAVIANTLSQIFANVVTVTSDETIARASTVNAISDSIEGCGPLAGVHAALEYCNKPVFCVAVDMPYLSPPLIRYMLPGCENWDVVIPRHRRGYEPMHAIYCPSCMEPFEREMCRASRRPLWHFVEKLNIRTIEEDELLGFDTDLKMFENWNYPYDIPTMLTGRLK